MNKLLSIVLLSCTLIAFPSFAQDSEEKKYYVVTDSQGRKVYTDKPPIESQHQAKELNIRVSRPAGSSLPAEQIDSSELPFDVNEKIDEDWEDAGPGEKFAPNKSAACEASQRNYAVLSDPSRPAMKMDSDGQPVLLDDESRSAELERARADMQSYCG